MSRLLESFDQVYVVNLPSRADRRKEISEELRKIGAGLGEGKVAIFDAVRPEGPGGFPSIGAHGCFMSHLGILRDATARGLKRILILEDDLDFSPDYSRLEDGVAEALQESDWGVFYGGYWLDEPIDPGRSGAVQEWDANRGVKTTHCVGFQGESISTLVGFLEAMLRRPPGDPDGGPMHVDGAYSWYRRLHPRVKTLLATPEIGHQRPSRSDICSLRWYDRLFLVRDVVSALRRRRKRLSG